MTEPTHQHADTDAGVTRPRVALDNALEGLLAAIDALDAALPYLEDQPEGQPMPWPRDPEDLLWTTQRTALAAEELGALIWRLGDHAEEWATLITSDVGLTTMGMSRHSATTYLARVKELPKRLQASSRAMALAARRGSLDELRWFIEPPRVRVRVDDLGSVDVELAGEQPERYSVCDARPGPVPLHERERSDADTGGLVGVIASTLGVDLADTQLRRLAREAAGRARRELEAIVRYRDSGKPGDAQHAANLAHRGDPADPQIAYAHRPDSGTDLVDVLLDLYREQWPVGQVLRDALAAACLALGGGDGRLAGADLLLAHRREDPVVAGHVRAIVEAWVRTADEYERRRAGRLGGGSVSENDVRSYSGLRLIPAALALLDLDSDPVARAAVTVEQVEQQDFGGRSWIDDEVTIDWTRLSDARRSSTALRLTAFARSMLDGIPVDMREIDHFGHGTFGRFMRALALAWPDPPPSIEDMQQQGWREITGEEFLRRAGGDDTDGPEPA